MISEIDATRDPAEFEVTITIQGTLPNDHNIFQFVATTPGSYRPLNIGRYVRNFEAYDRRGKLLEVERKSVNHFEIEAPQNLAKISYRMAETFDADTVSDEGTAIPDVWLADGSTIGENFALMNPHALVGYFRGLEHAPYRLRLTLADDWKVGTALEMQSGYYYANNFAELADSPILAGRLTFAETTIGDSVIHIYSYAWHGNISAQKLMARLSPTLKASEQFLMELPVKHYTFLYSFLNAPVGQPSAMEHSNSSIYVISSHEGALASDVHRQLFWSRIEGNAAHEFFHIVTPLNLHSEVIEDFSFEVPTPSRHLWLYEGVTEWASHILRLRAGLTELGPGPGAYLTGAVQSKILTAEELYDSSWSLERISLEAFSDAGRQQYGNVYAKGALAAMYLDIELLDLSGGRYGLRELILELTERYGSDEPFSEAGLIDEIVALTDPQIGDFFDRYVLGNAPLPHASYLAKIGIDYRREGSDHVVRPMQEPTSKQESLFRVWSAGYGRQVGKVNDALRPSPIYVR